MTSLYFHHNATLIMLQFLLVCLSVSSFFFLLFLMIWSKKIDIYLKENLQILLTVVSLVKIQGRNNWTESKQLWSVDLVTLILWYIDMWLSNNPHKSDILFVYVLYSL